MIQVWYLSQTGTGDPPYITVNNIDTMTNDATMILFYLKKHPEATVSFLMELSGLDYSETKNALKELHKLEKISYNCASGSSTIYLINNIKG